MNLSAILTFLTISMSLSLQAQTASLQGKVTSGNEPVAFASVFLQGTQWGAETDISGTYQLNLIPAGTYTVQVSVIGYDKAVSTVTIHANDTITLDFSLTSNTTQLNEVVISGTMKEVSKSDSPVSVEVYNACFFKSNPTPSIFDALQNINGVRPQINCNVCNTGDIHINGLEGPYTMVLIDGMPIVSGLSTVYGLSGIPQSLIDRVEIVKGPASTLYGSEAVGGLVNIITKKPGNAPLFSSDVFATGWGEVNTDLAAKFNAGKNAQALLGLNYFNFQIRVDNNADGFTDMTLQNRISLFNKWNMQRKHNRIFSLAGRYIYEDRWGGDMNWSKAFRGGDSIYGESIYTSRWEIFGTYQLPVEEKVFFQFSANAHDQNSVYGNIPFKADQKIAFGQLNWFKQSGAHDLLSGVTYRYTYYDDNTPATAAFDSSATNMPAHTYLPGVFVQDEWRMHPQHTVLMGFRLDYNSIHGTILTPRVNYKWSSISKQDVLRVSFGNGYRVANVFTEDHAALTGSRQVEFLSEIQPETSWNGNVNYVKKMYTRNGVFINLDASAFYTYFTNKIIADYETDPNKIIYDNLSGYAISQGVSLNLDLSLPNGFKVLAGGTYLDVYSVENNIKERQLFTERFAGVWNIGYTFNRIELTIDYTGNVYSPMRLPLLNDLDPRKAYSPWWSIQNIQLTKKIGSNMEMYGGIKNLLNWTPNNGNPFIISRSHDPFDKEVAFGPDGQALSTPNNPYALTFDPTYVYGPNQGIRGFLGFRYIFNE